MTATQARFRRAVNIFKRHNGILRMQEALNLDIDRNVLYKMLDDGVVERLGRGLYRLSDLPIMGNPDLATVALQSPNGVVCLISALAFHELTTQVPHEVDFAIPRRMESPRIQYPPIRIFRFSGRSFSDGVEIHHFDGTAVSIYCPAKTIADCFKFRNKIGFDVALEALKLFRYSGKFDVRELMEYATVCRVDKIIRPYIEALL